MKTILFSLIGKTDPIANCYDGSMLFLCRKKRPDVVVLYITESFWKYHDVESGGDDRYRRAIKKLGDHLHHEFEIKVIERPEQRNAHLVGTFYEDFENEFERLFREYGEDSRVMVNFSQGTPAMKSALLTICAMSNHNISLKQVSSPSGGVNRFVENLDDYDLDTYWENDLDNEDSSEIGDEDEINEAEVDAEDLDPDRRYVIKVDIASFNKRVQKEVISRQIENYDYQAAFLVAQMIRDTLNPEVLTLLEIAVERTRLNRRTYLTLLKQIEDKSIIPYRSDDKILLYEYALWMRMKQKRKDYLDFVRGISPVLFSLCEYALKIRFEVTIEDYCIKRNGVQYLSPKVMEKTEKGNELLAILNVTYQDQGGYRETFLSGVHMVALVEGLAETDADRKIAKKLRELREVEEDVRHIAAHHIVYIDESIIKARTAKRTYGSEGKTSGDILEIIRDLLKRLGMETEKDGYWNSYDCLNQRINSVLRI